MESHQPSGLGWFSVGCLFSTPLLFNPLGFNPLGRGYPSPLPPPQGSGPRVSRGATASCTVFLVISLPFFFASFFRCLFGSIFDRCSTPTWRQLGLQNRPKSMKNRCQDAFPSWLDFSSILDRFFFQLRPPELWKKWFSPRENVQIQQNRFSKLISFFHWF